jgi:hypothetical protein
MYGRASIGPTKHPFMTTGNLYVRRWLLSLSGRKTGKELNEIEGRKPITARTEPEGGQPAQTYRLNVA